MVKEPGVGDMPCGCGIRNQRKDAIIRRQKNTAGTLHLTRNGAAGAADAGIDDDNVDRARRKILAGILNNDGGFPDVEGRHVVRNIDDLRGWRDTENYSFHRSHERVRQAEVRR